MAYRGAEINSPVVLSHSMTLAVLPDGLPEEVLRNSKSNMYVRGDWVSEWVVEKRREDQIMTYEHRLLRSNSCDNSVG